MDNYNTFLAVPKQFSIDPVAYIRDAVSASCFFGADAVISPVIHPGGKNTSIGKAVIAKSKKQTLV